MAFSATKNSFFSLPVPLQRGDGVTRAKRALALHWPNRPKYVRVERHISAELLSVILVSPFGGLFCVLLLKGFYFLLHSHPKPAFFVWRRLAVEFTVALLFPVILALQFSGSYWGATMRVYP